MAKNNQQPEGSDTNLTPPPLLSSIEELKVKKKTPEAIFCGVCTAQGWRPGRGITEEDYDKAVADFGGSPIGSRRRI